MNAREDSFRVPNTCITSGHLGPKLPNFFVPTCDIGLLAEHSSFRVGFDFAPIDTDCQGKQEHRTDDADPHGLRQALLLNIGVDQGQSTFVLERDSRRLDVRSHLRFRSNPFNSHGISRLGLNPFRSTFRVFSRPSFGVCPRAGDGCIDRRTTRIFEGAIGF